MSDQQAVRILAVSSGWSSLKFTRYDLARLEKRLAVGRISGIGHGQGVFRLAGDEGETLIERRVSARDHQGAARILLEWMHQKHSRGRIDAVGHRVVHGGLHYRESHWVTGQLLETLARPAPMVPDHLPAALEIIRAVAASYPDIRQVACFDTAFHRSMPEVAKMYALLSYLCQQGVMRHGFHGLSYECIVEELRTEAGPQRAGGRVIIARLGSGASMVAVDAERSVETTMGFTPAGGLVMSTRCGDLDPGVVLFLLRQKGMSPSEVTKLVNEQAGLLAVSGLSADMKGLLERMKQDPNAAKAVDLFCYHAKRSIGALTAVLGGLDDLIFTGGIGERAPGVRARICSGLDLLGIHLDADSNEANAGTISNNSSPVMVRIMKTNEELMIARHTRELLC